LNNLDEEPKHEKSKVKKTTEKVKEIRRIN